MSVDAPALVEMKAQKSREPSDEEILREANKAGWDSGIRLRLLQMSVFASVLVAWQIASSTVIDSRFISSPIGVFDRLREWTLDGTLIFHLTITLQETLLGYVLGATAGVIVGVVMGKFKVLGDVMSPFIASLYSLPKVALAPLFILWIGIGISMKIALAAITVFFLVYSSALKGVRDIDNDLLDFLKIVGASRTQVLRYLIVPSAAAQIFLGLRLAVPYALIGAIVGELVASNRGVGYLIYRASGQFDAAGVFSGLVVLALFSALLYDAVARAERWFIRWKY